MENIWQTAVEFAARAGADGFALFLLFLLLLLAILQGGRERRFRRVLVNALEKHLPQIENGISSSRETAAKERDRHATAILDALHRRVDGQTAEVADTARAALRQEIEKKRSATAPPPAAAANSKNGKTPRSPNWRKKYPPSAFFCTINSRPWRARKTSASKNSAPNR